MNMDAGVATDLYFFTDVSNVASPLLHLCVIQPEHARVG